MIWKTMIFMMPAFLAVAQPSQQRWIAAVAGGYSWFSPKDLNDMLTQCEERRP